MIPGTWLWTIGRLQHYLSQPVYTRPCSPFQVQHIKFEIEARSRAIIYFRRPLYHMRREIECHDRTLLQVSSSLTYCCKPIISGCPISLQSDQVHQSPPYATSTQVSSTYNLQNSETKKEHAYRNQYYSRTWSSQFLCMVSFKHATSTSWGTREKANHHAVPGNTHRLSYLLRGRRRHLGDRDHRLPNWVIAVRW